MAGIGPPQMPGVKLVIHLIFCVRHEKPGGFLFDMLPSCGRNPHSPGAAGSSLKAVCADNSIQMTIDANANVKTFVTGNNSGVAISI
jgi:hypothetical protein